MENSHLIIVKHIGTTNTAPSRIKLTSTRYGNSIRIPYQSDNKTQDAIDYLTLQGFEITGKAWNEQTGETYLLTSTFKKL